VNIHFQSHAFSNGFDIATPSETLRAAASPFGEMLISNAAGTQIARVAKESLLGSVYDIVISGGELYQFEHAGWRHWTCTGGGRTFQLREENLHRFVLEAESKSIAEGSKEWLTGNYTVTLLEDADFKVVVCIFMALSMIMDRGAPSLM
jgi:uncharacterized protein YxjI